MCCQRTLFIKSAIALIEQNDPQLQTQLEIKSSVSPAGKDHRICCKKEFFSSPVRPSQPPSYLKCKTVSAAGVNFSTLICQKKKHFVLQTTHTAARIIESRFQDFPFKTTTTVPYFWAKTVFVASSLTKIFCPPRKCQPFQQKSNSMCPRHEGRLERFAL